MIPELRIKKVDEGRCQVVYETKNVDGEKIYYSINPWSSDSDSCVLYRCSQPFKNGWEKVYEPQNKATPKDTIRVELPEPDTRLGEQVRNFINNNPLMEGF
jgi:hypothetical protein